MLCGACNDQAPAEEERPLVKPHPLSTDSWTYIQVDSTKAKWGDFDDPDWLRYFGLALGDVDGSGGHDIVTGRNIYLQERGSGLRRWKKIDLGQNVDANLYHEPEDGKAPYILGEALPDVIRFEIHPGFERKPAEVVAQVPPTGHHNGQGFKTADLFPDYGSDEVIYASQGGLYVLDPSTPVPWKVTLVGKDASDEGFGVADMDNDGDLDLISGYRVPGADAEVPTLVVWFENPGTLTANWALHEIGRSIFATDRVEAADLNGDGKADVVVAEERYPGLEPDANLWAFFQVDTGFVRKKIVTQYSMNNLDIVDMDRDGDQDLITAEHKGPDLALQLWLNDGAGNFTMQEIDRGKESHLGTKAYDLDGDGDLDIISIGWDQHQYVHVWRNDAVRNPSTDL